MTVRIRLFDSPKASPKASPKTNLKISSKVSPKSIRSRSEASPKSVRSQSECPGESEKIKDRLTVARAMSMILEEDLQKLEFYMVEHEEEIKKF